MLILPMYFRILATKSWQLNVNRRPQILTDRLQATIHGAPLAMAYLPSKILKLTGDMRANGSRLQEISNNFIENVGAWTPNVREIWTFCPDSMNALPSGTQ
jgi:hypothetical protein